tara:strand:+ start:33 stop:638 length:606 start_codon:yes stop_codon:yes gene_type:complete
MSTLEVNTINPQSGNDITLGGSSKNVKFASGTTVDFNTNTPTLTLGADMKNTPMVYAYMNASQTVSDNTHTKIQYNTEGYDTDSAYDHSSNYRFTVPSGKGGKYFIHAACYQVGNNNDEKMLEVSIYKNGSQVQRSQQYYNFSTSQAGQGVHTITRIMDLAASDYIEIYGRLNVNSGTPSFYGASADDQRYSTLHIAKMIG